MKDRFDDVSVVLATYNEVEHITELIQELLEKLPGVEIIVVDDNSTDGTICSVDALSSERVILIKRRVRGLASAFHRGIIESSGDIICWLDADLCMPVDVLRKLILELDSADIAIGSRYAAGGSDSRHWIRVLASKAVNGFANLILGGNIKDYDSGFVALKREVFDSVTIIPTGHGEYFIEMIYQAFCRGMRIVEVGYGFRDRSVGVSKSMPSLGAFLITGAHYVVRILVAKFRIRR